MNLDKHQQLASYILDVYKDFKSNRSELDDTWGLAYDAFRGQYEKSNLSKWKELEGNAWRSKVFVKLTKWKIVAAVSQINDVLFQGGTFPFDLMPTDLPEFAPGIPMPEEFAKQRARLCKKKIEDIVTECRGDKCIRTSVLESAIYGVSCLKSPVVRPATALGWSMEVPGLPPGIQADQNMIQQYGRPKMIRRQYLQTVLENPSIWDIFWDMEAEDFNGRAHIQRAWMSPGMLSEFIGRPYFIKEAIELANQTHNSATRPETQGQSPAVQRVNKTVRDIEVLEFWGKVPARILKEADVEGFDDGDLKDDRREVEIFTVLADSTIIRKPVKNPLPAQMRPFHFWAWEELPHESNGVGVAENIRDCQMMVNGGARAYIDNKAISGNVLGGVRKNALAPNENSAVWPGKMFEFGDQIQDIRQALSFFSPPDVGAGLLEMISLFQRFADEGSNLPSFLQGESKASDPKTAFAFGQLVTNANKALGNVIGNLDEAIKSTITSLYYWEMANNPDPNFKGDFRIKANGFNYYKSRVLRGQELTNYLLMNMGNPELAMRFKPWPILAELAQSHGFDPHSVHLTDEEYAMAKMQMLQQQMAADLQAQAQKQPSVSEAVGLR